MVLFTLLNSAVTFASGFWPEGDYKPEMPSVKRVLGYEPGERITNYRDTLRYFKALANASPERVTLVKYAKSWQGRDLFYVVISSPDNKRRLDDIKVSMQQLADPRKTSRKQAEQLIRSLPAVVWLSYGVHGNEISSTDAAMQTAYHLLASKDDTRLDNVLKNTVVIIDPLQNPDGRTRFIHNFESAEGLYPDADPMAAEHDEPWPGGRTNHYLFDLNRDWFVQTQPETKGRIQALLEWFPVVFVDAHETGSNFTYFFAPPAKPFNPHLTQAQQESLSLIGQNNARWFDQLGIDYFTGEVFDGFYPGYGSGWPTYFGSIAMTYEQGSTRGLVVRRDNGQELHYRDAVRHHFVSSLATLETVANRHTQFLKAFYDYRESAIEEGKQEAVRAYLIPKQDDSSAVDKLVNLLLAQGIEVEHANVAFDACGRTYTSGAYRVRSDQPAKRLIRNLLDRQVPISKQFLNHQEQRRKKKLKVEIYDVTAWSLPLMFNVTVDACKRLPKGQFEQLITPIKNVANQSLAAAKVAYIVPWGSASAVRFLSAALLKNVKVKSSDKAFTHQGTEYPAGTLILNVADNPDNLAAVISELSDLGADIIAVDQSWVTSGPGFGSPSVVDIHKPRIAMAWDHPTNPLSAGSARFVIERQFDYPVTPIRVSRLATADLSRYQVLILPGAGYAGSYADTLGEAGARNLKDWVNRGGVLIGLDSANHFLADPTMDLLAIRREDASVDSSDKGKQKGEAQKGKNNTAAIVSTVAGKNINDPSAYQKAIAAHKAAPDKVPGALVKAVVDPDHWLSAGVAPSLNVLVRNGDIYTPIRLDKGTNIARFGAADQLLQSGTLWEENRKQLAYKPFVVAQPTGRGFIIGFTQDPTTRAYLDGLNVLFMNAVFRAPAHARPVR